ncbi:nuclear transport factor 2 family protein [Streptomyces sp. NPDC004610]|uniref:nuclear transport factor 2 family protein n=1 Tax=unclassified Streptomyces TaxID=2593676 RepID=UPI0033A85263
MERTPDRRRPLRGAAVTGLVTGVAAAGALLPAPAAAVVARRRDDRVLRVANAAMDAFDNGWRTGDWQPFLALLTDDFSFWFPDHPARGRFEGTTGRRTVADWTAFHAAHGNHVSGTRRRATPAGDRVFYEYESVGTSVGTAAYRNWELIVVTVRGERLSALHEYWGDARPVAGGASGAP